MKITVVERPVRRLRRGDAILAIGWPGMGKRAMGVSQRSRVLGRFVLRRAHADGTVAVVYRRPDDVLVGESSSYPADAPAFVAEGGAR